MVLNAPLGQGRNKGVVRVVNGAGGIVLCGNDACNDVHNLAQPSPRAMYIPRIGSGTSGLSTCRKDSLLGTVRILNVLYYYSELITKFPFPFFL